MLEKKIQLKAFSDVKEFVKAAEKCEYDVDVFYNRVVVDAKSILGVMSMDLTRPLTVKYHVEDQDCFEQTLNKFAM
ncbi:MAG: HPr family phosphocarrier protein [Lachnospiraceae bacterium]